MANTKCLSAVICYAILLSAYHEVSATCTNCSMYLDFTLWKPVLKKIADFHLLTITDRVTTCKINFGDSNTKQKRIIPGLKSQHVVHTYQDAGPYVVICTCQNVTQTLSIVATTSTSSTLKFEAEYNASPSLVNLKLKVDSGDCSDTVKCNIYFGKQNIGPVTVKTLRSGFSKKPKVTGFLRVGLKCPCSPDIIYMEQTIRVYNDCFEEYLFRSFPQTSEQDPFVIYENSNLLIEVSRPITCATDITSREWIIKKKVGAIFEPVKWTFSDIAAFPENASFGLYSIELNASTEQTSQIDTLYLLYKKIIRPLNVYGGSFQSMDPSQTVSLSEEEDQEGVHYLWCYHKNAKAINITKPLFNIGLQGKVNCEPFTQNKSIQVPANLVGKVLFIEVFAITETDFREGRSVIKLMPMERYNKMPVNIRCIYNCAGQVSTKMNLVLSSEIDENYSQENSSVTYTWSIMKFESNKYVVFKGQGIWSEGSDTSTFTVIGDNLPPNTWIKICVRIKSDSLNGLTCNEVFCGSPPSNGICSISTTNGVALETNFTINCTGYVDDGVEAFRAFANPHPSYAGLLYVVLFVSDENMVVIYYGVFPQIGPFNLGSGDSGTHQANLYIRVYDMYYSFDNTTVDMTVKIPSTMDRSAEDIEKYLLGRISNIDNLPRQDQFNIMNSVSGVINKMKIKTLMQNIEYNVKDMIHGKFIDFDLAKDVFKTWEDMTELIADEDNIVKIMLYSKIISESVVKIDKLLIDNDSAIGLLAALGTLNLAVSYHPYVSQVTMAECMNSSASLLLRALQLCQKSLISVFMTDITDCTEIMLGRMMSIINTDQIILAREGFEWDKIRKYMDRDQRYVGSRIVDTAMGKSQIDEFERYYILQKTYLRSNILIDRKRNQAKILSNNLVDTHLHYLKALIDAISTSGRKSKSKTGTFICAKKTSGTKNLDGIGCGQLNVKMEDNNSSESENVANIQALTTNEKLFTYDKDMRSSLISQPTMIVKMGNETTTNRSFVIKFGKLSQTPTPETPDFIAGDQARLFYHRFLYRSKTDFACIRLTPVKSTLDVLGYETYFQILAPPNNDSFDYRTAFSHENLTDGYYQMCVPPGIFKSNGSLFVAFRPFFPSGVTGNASDLLAPYSFEAISASCLMWDETLWVGDTCRLIWTDHVACECFSNKQVTVSNTFFVPPNAIDFSTVFSKFDIINNSTVFSVVVGIFLLFIIILVIALRQDRKDEHVGHFRSLSDNYRDDNFYYLLIVYTGLKVSAGTQSNICFLLSGEHATSGVRSLSDETHKGFKSGSVRKFLMTTPSNLGDLIFLKIWTDGSGIGEESSWFLDRFEVMEVSTEKKFIFRCNAWLTTDESGRTLYIIPCNRFQDEMTFSCRFKENMYESMTDGHLWFSSYMRPCYGQFTRAQRVTCCTLVLYLTMIINAMFYRAEENIIKPNQFTLGPLRFSLSQITISLQSIAITFPPTFLVLILFKNSKPSKYKPLFSLEKGEKRKSEHSDHLFISPEEFPGNGFLPHFCVYIGWIISFLAILASGFFVILYSMQWGKTKSEEWMTTFLLSSGESLFFVDPIKIFLIAFIIAFLGKAKRRFKLTYFDNMSILQEVYYILYKRKDKPAKFSIFPPMGRREKMKRQKSVHHEIWLKSILLNFVMYALLLWASSSLAFTNRNQHAFIFKDHVQKTFVNPHGSAVTFSGIKTVTSFYQWARNIVYPSLFPMTDYKGDRLVWLDKKFIKDGVNMKVGPMRLRQLRIQTPENCSTYHLVGILDCYPPYSFSREETASYCLRWKEGPKCGYELAYNETLVAWSYTRASQISGLPIVGVYNTYGGGGYIMNFQVNNYISNKIQDEFNRALWIDRKTRAVFLEFTLYNANTNQFANVFFLIEFPESGGAIPYYQINVITAYNSFDPYTVTCLVVFGLCFIMFIIKNSYNLIMERTNFFKNFWNLVDLSAFISTSSMSAAYVIQYYGTQAVLEQFRQDPRIFVNFYYLVVLNQLITYNLAFQIFFTVIRVSCILGISQRISELAAVMKHSISELTGVFYIFALYVLAFTVVGNICFATTYSYRSYGSSLMAVFLLLLGKNNFTELIAISPIIGKIYFISKIFFMIFIIMKMFEGVLSESISSKKKMRLQLSLLELFTKQLKISRLVHLPNAVKKKNQKEKIYAKEDKF